MLWLPSSGCSASPGTHHYHHPPPHPQELDPLCAPLAWPPSQGSGLTHPGGSLRTYLLPPWEIPALDTRWRPQECEGNCEPACVCRGVFRHEAVHPAPQDRLSRLVPLPHAWPPSSILSPGQSHVLFPSLVSPWSGLDGAPRSRGGAVCPRISDSVSGLR